LSPEGVVLGADSTASFQLADGPHYFNNAQKLFEVGPVGSTLGMIVWGMGGLQESSHRTLIAQLADGFKGAKKPKTVGEVMNRWIDHFWAAYSKEQAGSIARVKSLDAMPAHDPNGQTPGCRSEAEDSEYKALKLGLAVGFCIGGYILPDRTAHALFVVFEPLLPKPKAIALPMHGYGFWGAPIMVNRLLFGADERLKDAILKSGHWNGKDTDLDAVLSAYRLQHLRMPIRDAIDFVNAYILSTIKAFKFSSLAQICGGPIELAVIRTDRAFEWVRHKPWDAALEEGVVE
jgi:hypothetical protein